MRSAGRAGNVVLIVGLWFVFGGATPPPEAVRLYQEGVRLASEKGDYSAALTRFQQALELAPSFAEAAFALGQSYGALAQLDRAAQFFQEALRLADTPELRFRAALALGEVAYRQGRWEVARKAARQALELDAQNPRVWNLLGDLHAQQGELEEAIAAYREALRRDPDRSAAWTGLAAVLLESGRIEEALEAAQEAAQRQPFAPTPYFLQGKCLARLGRRQEAAEALKRHRTLQQYVQQRDRIQRELAQHPDPELLLRLGRLHASVGNWEAALQTFEQAIRRMPANDAAHLGRIEALVRLRRVPEVVAAVREWTEQAPRSPLAWSEWGLLNYRQGDLEAAIDALERSLQLDPDQPSVWNNLAWIYAEANRDLDRALDLAQQAVQREPSGTTYDTLAFVLLRRGERQAAQEALEKAVALDPDNAEFRRKLEALRREDTGR